MFVFIPGLSRCGTTWVTNWLKTHSDVHLQEENYILLNSYKKHKNTQSWENIIKNAVINKFNEYNSNKSVFIDKSPEFITFVPIIRKLFPTDKIMCFYKYGPNLVYSYMHLPSHWVTHKEWTIEEAVDTYIENAKMIDLNNIDPNIIYIRYEELLKKPVEMSKKILNFIGLSDTIGSLEVWKKPANTDHKFYDNERWKTLGSEAIEYMKKMNTELIRLGYEPI